MSLAATVLQAVRHRKDVQQMDAFENRTAQFGFLRMFQEDTPNLLSARIIEQAKQAATHVQQAVVMNKGPVTVNNVRSCTIADKESTSALYTFVWATYSFDFTMNPQAYYNNEIEYAVDMAQKMREGDEALAIAFEQGSFNAANAAKNLTATYNAQTPYPVAGDHMEVAAASQFDFYNQLRAIFKLHNFRQTKINIVGSTLIEPDVTRYGVNSSLKLVGNAVTDSFEAWQLMGYNWKFSEFMPAIALVRGRVFASAPGAYGIMNWNPKAFQVGAVTSNGTKFEETPVMPMTGMQLGHQYKSDCLTGDQVKEFHQFSTDVCYVTAYNSDPATKAGGIFEARMMTT